MEGVFWNHGITNVDQLDVPFAADHCKELGLKLDKWERLALFIGLTEEDCTAIKEDLPRNYESQRIISLTKWRRKLGTEATYLSLARGLQKVGRVDLIEDLVALYRIRPRPTVASIIDEDQGAKGC